MANKDAKPGIYRITRIDNGDTYVGSSAFIYQRWSQHRVLLRKGKHHSPRLQRSWTKHGEDAFEFVILEECEVDQLLVREQFHLDALSAIYNTAKIAGTRRGVPQSEESKQKTREAMIGREVGPEARAKLSEYAKANGLGSARRGATQTPEARAKISAAMQGNQRKAGVAWSEESKAKSSAAQKGRLLTPEHREKLRLAWIARRARTP